MRCFNELVESGAVYEGSRDIVDLPTASQVKSQINGYRSERRQVETATTKTATTKTATDPKRRQANTATIVVKTATRHKSKLRQPLVKTATNILKTATRHKSKRRQSLVKTVTNILKTATKTATSLNVNKPDI